MIEGLSRLGELILGGSCVVAVVLAVLGVRIANRSKAVGPTDRAKDPTVEKGMMVLASGFLVVVAALVVALLLS